MLSRSGSAHVVDQSEQRGIEIRRHNENIVTRATIESSFLVDGLGLDASLFEASIHQLPPELLSHIFSFDDRTTYTFPTPFAWTVAHVCGHWRQVAFNTPKLWSTIVLDLSSLHSINKRLGSQLQFLDTCLALSKSVPLDFVVALRGGRFGVCNDVLSRLCRHTRRWRRAFFFLPSDVLAPWSHWIRGNTPVLQSLGFGSVGEGIGSIDLQNVFGNSNASRLALSYCPHETIGALSVPWQQITSLMLVSFSFDTLPTILSNFPNLRELEFEGELSRFSVLHSGDLIELPNLLNLRISGYSHRVTQLLPRLHTPALVNLSITLYRALDIKPGQHITSARVVADFVRAATLVKHPVVKFINKGIKGTIWSHAIRYIQ